MPKMKTHSASKKRFKRNCKGNKLKRSKAYRRHHAWAKTSKQVQQLKKCVYLEGAEKKKIEVLLPY
ncbi:50S ribosomal protein L35 [Candidatus Babeliales bacterium]|nr:50S ribosomal protein L35 [Candidatus Babeliales bacterium]